MATKTRRLRITAAERAAAAMTNFEGISSWDYTTPAGKRKGELESQARKLAHGVSVLLTEAAATSDASERATLATVAARRLAEALAFAAPYQGLDLPELLK